MTTRREFLATALGSSAVISVGASVPSFLLRAAEANQKEKNETILVVLQLSGGNDGLNTVIPYRDPEYRGRRPNLAISADEVLKINDDLGFHPSMRGMADLLEAGQAAVVQGVGYPNPNRSHFESMDIWHTCRRKGNARTTGWIGRFVESARATSGSDAPALHLGAEKQPLALAAPSVRVPSIRSIDRFRLQHGTKKLRSAVNQLTSGERVGSELLGFVQTSTESALNASLRVEEANAEYKTPIEYPDSALAERFRTVAQLIEAGLRTRVYYVALDGFDTHSRQPEAHASLLGKASSSMAAFVKDMEHHGHADRVLVMAFSEFGRRVQENASDGTDHGAAGPMLLAGGKLQPGVHGQHPSLTDLHEGDLKFAIDFRQVYASVLENWLGWPAGDIVGADFRPLEGLI